MTRSSDVILKRMMTMHPKVIDLTLDRMLGLLPKLGSPEASLPPIIHIAGTNGKGSTQAMIRAGLEGAGKRVHAYTSPHLARFHERIRVAGELISEPDLTAVLNECERANAGTNITYFEITTAAALLAFARTPADYTLLEVGLGGEFDATNVFTNPVLTVITPVSYDHQQYLGNTLSEIASAKAGIIKRGVPCIVGPQEDEGMAVIEAKARKMAAPLLAYGQHWHVGREGDRLIYQDEHGLLDLPLPNLPGPHQIMNAGAALAVLRTLDMGEPAYEAAVTQAYWPARMEHLKSGVLVDLARPAELWLDGGHNPSAGEALALTLRQQGQRPTHLICGMLNTKDIAGFLRPLAGVALSLTAVSIPDEVNTIPAEDTARHATAVGLDTNVAASVEEAVRQITARDRNARILICGSLYLAGHVLRVNHPAG